MPVETSIWKVDGDDVSAKVDFSVIESEKRLEEILKKNISILGNEYLIIGRQVRTSYGKIIDLLAISRSGKITIIELKRDRTPREVVAQTLDYASWINQLSYSDIEEIYKDNFGKEKPFEKAFVDKFDENIPEEINEEHDMLIVSASLDNETERIINYLSSKYNVPINAVFFRFFKDNSAEYITRTWLLDPLLVEEKAETKQGLSKSEAWNGLDFVVNIDSSDEMSAWEDYRKYGFISASGGQRYASPLSRLFVGARVFAMIPQKGYLGVGEVVKQREKIRDFEIEENGIKKKLSELPLKAKFLVENLNDDNLCSYVVGIKWIKAVDENLAYWERGLKANQNTAFKLNSSFTIEKLSAHFQIE